MTQRFPCPCCGHLVFHEPPGSYAICPVCFWEDDLPQLRWPDMPGGANTPSLIEAQWAYAELGACEPRQLPHVRPPAPDEPVEVGWRRIDPAVDRFERYRPPGPEGRFWPDDSTVFYWWRSAPTR